MIRDAGRQKVGKRYKRAKSLARNGKQGVASSFLLESLGTFRPDLCAQPRSCGTEYCARWFIRGRPVLISLQERQCISRCSANCHWHVRPTMRPRTHLPVTALDIYAIICFVPVGQTLLDKVLFLVIRHIYMSYWNSVQIGMPLELVTWYQTARASVLLTLARAEQL